MVGPYDLEGLFQQKRFHGSKMLPYRPTLPIGTGMQELHHPLHSAQRSPECLEQPGRQVNGVFSLAERRQAMGTGCPGKATIPPAPAPSCAAPGRTAEAKHHVQGLARTSPSTQSPSSHSESASSSRCSSAPLNPSKHFLPQHTNGSSLSGSARLTFNFIFGGLKTVLGHLSCHGPPSSRKAPA